MPVEGIGRKTRTRGDFLSSPSLILFGNEEYLIVEDGSYLHRVLESDSADSYNVIKSIRIICFFQEKALYVLFDLKSSENLTVAEKG